MQKIFLISFLSILLSNSALAKDDNASLSLFDDEETQEVEKKADTAKTESIKKGIFSFLNFKEKDETTSSLTKTGALSPFEQKVKLADAGDLNAQLSVGYTYLYGADGITAHYSKAFEYYHLAAQQDDAIALNNLGSLYYNGIGTAVDTNKAAILFDKSSQLGNVDASVNLAFMLIAGNGIKKDTNTALNIFENAAIGKNPTAQFMIGYAYYKGIERPKDYKKSAEFMKASALSGFDEAQHFIALMYINGSGLPQNFGKAVKYLNDSSNQGNTLSMVTLANILVKGEKYTKDLTKAHVMFNLASVRGAEGAAEKRDLIGSRLKIEEVLQAQTKAERFKDAPTDLTAYIRQTFGNNIYTYIEQ